MKLGFTGYGGDFCVGKLTANEIANITDLLSRFDRKLFLSTHGIIFDTNDFKREYFDFDDIFQFESVSLPCSILINSLPEDCKFDGIDSFSSDDAKIEYEESKPLEDGFYVTHANNHKGEYFGVEIDVEPSEFDVALLTLQCKDLDCFSMSERIIQDVYYDGKLLEMDCDDYYTEAAELEQSIIYVNDGKHYDGLEELESRIKTQYPKIYELPEIYLRDRHAQLPHLKFIHEFEAYMEAKNSGYLLDDGTNIVYASPILYDNFPKEDVDALWMTEENIKFVIEHDLVDDMPNDVYTRIINRFPEWLI